MKRINLLFMSLLCVWISATAQVGQQSQEPVDSIKNIGYMDSLFQELPEVMIIWGIERSGFFNGREKWAKGFENQRV